MDNFQAYGEFARVYDMFQDNVDYQTWGKWLKQQLAAQGITDGLVLDLGCGTGTMTEILAEAGYDMIGVDNSGEMLAEAMEKRVESGHDILYLLQDMQEFEPVSYTHLDVYKRQGLLWRFHFVIASPSGGCILYFTLSLIKLS